MSKKSSPNKMRIKERILKNKFSNKVASVYLRLETKFQVLHKLRVKLENLYSKILDYKKIHPKRFYALATAFGSGLMFILIGSIWLITGLFRTETNIYIPENINNSLGVVSVVPNQNTAPHPILEPLIIEFEADNIEVEKFEASFVIDPQVELEFSQDEENLNKFIIKPLEGFAENTQYNVKILADEIKPEDGNLVDFEYYFFTQGKNSSDVNGTTILWPDSVYNSEHEYRISEYLERDQALFNNLQYTVYKSDLETFISSVTPYLNTLEKDNSRYAKYVPTNGTLEELETWSVDVTNGEYNWSASTNIPIKDKGVYFLKIMNGSQVLKTNFITLNETALISKILDNNKYFFTSDLKSSEKIEGVDLKVYNLGEDKNLNVVGDLKTNNDGLASFDKSGDFVVSTYNNDVIVSPLTYSLASYMYEYDNSYLTDKIYVVTDRELYKPGDYVNYKLIARKLVDDVWQNYPIRENIEVNLIKYNDGDQIIDTQNLKVGSNGTVSGTFKLATDKTGYMRIEGKNFSKYIQVEDYVKPVYEVNVNTEKEVYTNGEKMTVTIDGNMYSGSPASGAKVYLYIEEQYGSNIERCSEHRGYEENNYRQLDYKELTLDSNGKSKHEYEIKTDPTNTNKSISIIAEIRDSFGPISQGTKVVDYKPSTFNLNVTSSDYSAPINESIQMRINATKDDCKGVADKEVTVKTTKITYQKNSNDDSKYSYYKEIKEELGTETYKTDSNGRLVFDAKYSDQASYKLEISSKDKNGNEILTNYYLWFYDAESYGGVINKDGYSKQITIKLDKEKYKVGDTAKVTVFNPGIAGDLWFTTNRNSLHENKIVKLSEYKTEFEFEITEKYIPKATATIGMIVNNGYSSDSIDFEVDNSAKIVEIEVSPQKSTYKPGDTAVVNLNTSVNGNAERSELAIAVVDKAVVDISTSYYEDISEFFYPIWYSRAYDFSSLSNLNLGMDGGYGSGGGSRESFPDTAYWNPDIKTDYNGNASISFKLPDSLTDWAVIVWAVSDNQAFGQGTANFKVNKEITLNSFLPEQMVVGDKLSVPVSVSNNTDVSQSVAVKISKSSNLKASGELNKSITIPANSRENLYFQIEPTQTSDSEYIDLTLSGKYSDGLKLYTEILPKGFFYRQAVSGEGNISESITTTEANAELKINLSTNPIKQIPDGLNYLIGYTYGCSEQTSTKIVANILAITNRNKLSGLDYTDAELIGFTNEGLERLYAMQNSDGGWGWWSGNNSNPELSAYAVHALRVAKNNGFSVDSDSLKAGMNYLANNQSDNNISAYIQYVFSLNKTADTAKIKTLSNQDLYNSSKAYLALAARNMGDNSTAGVLIDYLVNNAETIGNSKYWRSTNKEVIFDGNELNVTAVVLRALNTYNNENSYKALSYLASRQEGGYWINTNTSLNSIMAILEYSDNLNQNPDFTYVLKVNGNVLKSATINSTNYKGDIESINVKLNQGDNKIELSKNGEGEIFLNAYTSEFRNDSSNINVENGIEIRNMDFVIFDGDLISSARKEFSVGDIVLQKIDLNGSGINYLQVRSQIPAGFIPINPNIAKSSYLFSNTRWMFDYMNNTEIFDQEFNVYLRDSNSMSQLYIPLIAVVPGEYNLNPVRVESMYEPEAWNVSKSDVITIRK